MRRQGRSDESAPVRLPGTDITRGSTPAAASTVVEKALAIPSDVLGPSRCPVCGQWFVSIKRPDLAAYCSDRHRYRDGKRKERARALIALMLRGEP